VDFLKGGHGYCENSFCRQKVMVEYRVARSEIESNKYKINLEKRFDG
jgi:hypothetical protein